MRALALALILAVLSCLSCDDAPIGPYPQPTVPSSTFVRPGGCMPLAKQTTFIPLGRGLRTDVDEKLLPIGATARIENGYISKADKVTVRNGTAALSSGLLGTADSLPPTWALGNLNGCLVSFAATDPGDHPVSQYSPTAGQWGTSPAPAAGNAGMRSSMRGPIVTSANRISGRGRYPDVAYASGYYFVAYVDQTSFSTPTVYEAVIDAALGIKVQERSFNTGIAAIFNLGVRVVNGYAVFVRDTVSSDLAFDAWQISNLDAGPTITNFATTTAASIGTNEFDIRVKDATTIQVAYLDQAGPKVLGVDFVPSTSTATGWTLNDSSAATVASDYALNWMQDFGGSGKIALITASSTQGVRVQWDIPGSGAIRQAVTTYNADAAPGTVNSVTGHTRGNSATGEFTILYDNGSGSNVPVIKTVSRTGGALGGSSIMYRGASLRSKTWTEGGLYYVVGEYTSSTQPTRYVLRADFDPFVMSNQKPQPLAMFHVRSGVGGSATGPISAVVSPAANQWTLATTVQLRLLAQPSGYGPQETGIELVTASFKQPRDISTGAPRQAIGSEFVPGGTLGQFDGSVFAEAGFAYAPDLPAAPTLAGGGGLTPSSNYFWKVTYDYPDGTGRIWRTGGDLMLTVTAATLGANTRATFALPTERITGRNDVLITLWRGAANDNVKFQKVGSVPNDTSVDTVSFADNVTDVNLAFGEFLYTNGGVLPNDPIPGAVDIAISGERLFFISTDDRSYIWVSNKFVPGIGLRFSEQNKFSKSDSHGGFTALGAMPDGELIAFKKDAVYAFIGDGPDPRGVGSFTPRLLSEGIGTADPRSVVSTNQGVYFKSVSTRAGFFRVSRALEIEYIGGPVQDFDSDTTVAAILIPEQLQLRFYSHEQRALVYDMTSQTWSVYIYSGFFPAAATYYNGGAAWYDDVNNTIFVDSAGYVDNGVQSYTLTLETPWLQFSGQQGFEKIYKVRGVGSQGAAHTLTSQLFADYATAPLDTRTVSPGANWNWEHKYSTKLAAVKWRGSIVINGSSPGDFSGISVEWGEKQGLQRSGNRAT